MARTVIDFNVCSPANRLIVQLSEYFNSSSIWSDRSRFRLKLSVHSDRPIRVRSIRMWSIQVRSFPVCSLPVCSLPVFNSNVIFSNVIYSSMIYRRVIYFECDLLVHYERPFCCIWLAYHLARRSLRPLQNRRLAYSGCPFSSFKRQSLPLTGLYSELHTMNLPNGESP